MSAFSKMLNSSFTLFYLDRLSIWVLQLQERLIDNDDNKHITVCTTEVHEGSVQRVVIWIQPELHLAVVWIWFPSIVRIMTSYHLDHQPWLTFLILCAKEILEQHSGVCKNVWRCFIRWRSCVAWITPTCSSSLASSIRTRDSTSSQSI